MVIETVNILQHRRRFRVALSFPGEYRDLIESIAEKLAMYWEEEQILYDKYHRAEFARPNLDTHLQKLYNCDSDIMVVFISDHYQSSTWCGLEWRAIRALMNQGDVDERIMFIRCGAGAVDGVFDTIDGYIDSNVVSIDDIVNDIIKRYYMVVSNQERMLTTNAQKCVDRHGFDTHKHLKDYNDVINIHRHEIDVIRHRVLYDKNLKDEILNQIASALKESIIKYAPERMYSADSWNLNGLYDDVQTLFGVLYRIQPGSLWSKHRDAVFDELWTLVEECYEEKEADFGSAMMRKFERSIFLMVIENLWKKHLIDMDHLKDRVQFRVFDQKNPLYEYRREGMAMFMELRSEIARDTSKYIFHMVRVKSHIHETITDTHTNHETV